MPLSASIASLIFSPASSKLPFDKFHNPFKLYLSNSWRSTGGSFSGIGSIYSIGGLKSLLSKNNSVGSFWR